MRLILLVLQLRSYSRTKIMAKEVAFLAIIILVGALSVKARVTFNKQATERQGKTATCAAKSVNSAATTGGATGH